MNVKKSFGEKVKRLRQKRRLTQEQLAEIIEISPRNLSKIEVGDCFVKAETLEKILSALNVSIEELFATEHIKSNSELIEEINSYINTVKDDNKMLEQIYKIVRDLVSNV